MKPRLYLVASLIAVGVSMAAPTVMAQQSGTFAPSVSEADMAVEENMDGAFDGLRFGGFDNTLTGSLTGIQPADPAIDRERRRQLIRGIRVALELAEFSRDLLIIGILGNSRDGIVRAGGLF